MVYQGDDRKIMTRVIIEMMNKILLKLNFGKTYTSNTRRLDMTGREAESFFHFVVDICVQ